MNLKRISALVIAVIMAFGVATTAFADVNILDNMYVSSIAIYVDAPVVGETPDFTGTFSSTTVGCDFISYLDFDGISWYNETDKYFMSETDVFEEDKNYIVNLYVGTRINYTLKDYDQMVATVNGFNATMGGLDGYELSKGACISVVIPVASKHSITITNGYATDKNGNQITEAAAGQTVTVVAEDKTGLREFNWWRYYGDTVEFADDEAETTTFVMPDCAVVIDAFFSNILVEEANFTIENYFVGEDAASLSALASTGIEILPIDGYAGNCVLFADNNGVLSDVAVEGNVEADTHYWIGIRFRAAEAYDICELMEENVVLKNAIQKIYFNNEDYENLEATVFFRLPFATNISNNQPDESSDIVDETSDVVDETSDVVDETSDVVDETSDVSDETSDEKDESDIDETPYHYVTVTVESVAIFDKTDDIEIVFISVTDPTITYTFKTTLKTTDDGKTTLDTGKTTLDDGKTTRDDGKTTLDDGKTTLDDGKTTLDDGKTTLDDGKTTLDDGKTTLDDGKTTLDTGKTTLDFYLKTTKTTDGFLKTTDIPEGEYIVKTTKPGFVAVDFKTTLKTTMPANLKTTLHMYGDNNSNGKIDSMDYLYLKRAYFQQYKLDLLVVSDLNLNGSIDGMDYLYLKRANFGQFRLTDIGKTTLDDGKTTLDKATLDDGKTTLDDGKTTLDDGKTTLDTGKTTLDDGKTTLDDGKTTLDDGKTTLDDGKTTLDTGKTTLDDGKTTLDTGKTTLDTGKTTLDTGKTTLDINKTIR